MIIVEKIFAYNWRLGLFRDFFPNAGITWRKFFFFQTNFIEVKLTYNKCTCFNCTFCINLYNHVTTTIIKMSVSQSVISVTQLCLTLRPHGLQHARLPCSSPIPGACSNLCPLSRWCHPISSSVVPFSFPFFFIFFNNASMKGGKISLSNSPKFQLSKGNKRHIPAALK